MQVEKLGVPVATVISEEFAAMSEASAREHGFDGMPLVTVQQPFDRLTRERVEEIAGEIVDDVVHALTTPADELKAEFTDRWHTSGGHTVACSIRVTTPAPAAAVSS